MSSAQIVDVVNENFPTLGQTHEAPDAVIEYVVRALVVQNIAAAPAANAALTPLAQHSSGSSFRLCGPSGRMLRSNARSNLCSKCSSN